MHQACQCVMRRLILLWIKGTRNIKLSDCQTDKVSAKLLALKVCMPNCFARKPRGLSEVERWKATEFREFMLYSGKLVLKGILRNDIYKHFMAFSVAMCILVSPRLIQMHKQYAQNLLVYFVTRGRELYVNEFVVYNVHAMLHIADDAEQFGNLDACAVFPFENYLQTIIRMVRSGNNVPVQVVKRISEQEITPRTTNSIKKSTVQLHKPNNAFLLEDSSCCEVVALSNEQDEDGKMKPLCRVYCRAEPAFLDPCDARVIGAYRINCHNSEMKILTTRTLMTKGTMV